MTSCLDPKHDISESKLVPCGNGQFWVLQTPQNHPRAPQGPPGAPGVQKWPKSSMTSPVVMIDQKNPIFKGGQFFSVFFTRNDPTFMQLNFLPHRNGDMWLNFPPRGWKSYHLAGFPTTWLDFLPRSWISYHVEGFPTTYLSWP